MENIEVGTCQPLQDGTIFIVMEETKQFFNFSSNKKHFEFEIQFSYYIIVLHRNS